MSEVENVPDRGLWRVTVTLTTPEGNVLRATRRIGREMAQARGADSEKDEIGRMATWAAYRLLTHWPKPKDNGEAAP